MINQIIFNSCLYLMGYIFLFTEFPFSMHLRHVLAYVIGIALWGIISTFCLIVFIPLKLITILSIFTVSMLFLIVRLKRKKFIFFKKKDIHKEFVLFFTYFSFFILANITVYYCNYIFVTYDSWDYMVIGEIIGKAGYFSYNIPHWQYFLKSRMVFLPMMHTGSYFFNIDLFHTIFPLMAIYLLLMFLLLFLIASKSIKLPKKLCLLLGISGSTLIVSVSAYWFYAYCIINHLFVSIYFSLCIFSIFIYKNQKNNSWLILAAISLGSSALARTEMSFFAVIPIVMLMSMKDLEKKDYRLFLIIFLSISFSWYIFRTYHLGLKTHWHGSGLAQIIIHLLYILSYFILCSDTMREGLISLLPNILISILLIFIVLSLNYLHEGMRNSIADLIDVISISKGRNNWGIIWLTIAVFVVIDVAFIKAKDLKFFIQVLLIFFLMRVILYSLGLFPAGSGSQFQSGNRMLLHIMPVGVFYVMSLFGYVLSSVFSSKTLTLES